MIMEQVTQELVGWMEGMSPTGIYAIFFFIAYIENIIPPLPGDVLLAFGGYLAAEAVIGLAPVYIVSTAASVIGFMTMYWLGSHWGMQIEERKERFWLIRFIPLKYMYKVQRWMQRWGLGVVVANRFLAGTRSVIALTAGISHTPVAGTVLSSTVSSLVWNAILLGFGWIVHKNWHAIGDYLSIYGRIILGLIAAFIIMRLLITYYRKKKGLDV